MLAVLEAMNRVVERILLRLLALLFGLLVVTVAWQVAGREAFGVAAIWTQEAALLLFTWCVFLGAAVAVRRSRHYACEVLPPSSRRARAVLKVVADLAVAAGAAVLLWGGVSLAEFGVDRDLETLGIAEVWQFAALPAGALLMLPFLIEVLLRDLATLRSARSG